MEDRPLEYFLIRTLPNKKRSLLVALRWGNRSKWRYQHVVPRVKVGLDLDETEAFTDAVVQSGIAENIPRYVRMCMLDKQEIFLKVAQTEGTSSAKNFCIWNRRYATSKKIMNPFNAESTPLRFLAWDQFLIGFGETIVFIPISKLDEPQKARLEFKFSVLKYFQFEHEIWLLKKDDQYNPTFSRTFGLIDLKKFRKSYRFRESDPIIQDSFMMTWLNQKRFGMYDIKGIAADSRNYYLHYEKKLKSVSRKTQQLVAQFELSHSSINGMTCRNSNLLYVSTTEALYCLKSSTLKMVSMQQYPNKQNFYGEIRTIIFSGVELVVCNEKSRVLVAACINFKFQYIYDTKTSGWWDSPDKLAEEANNRLIVETLPDNKGRLFLSGGKTTTNLVLVGKLLLI